MLESERRNRHGDSQQHQQQGHRQALNRFQKTNLMVLHAVAVTKAQLMINPSPMRGQRSRRPILSLKSLIDTDPEIASNWSTGPEAPVLDLSKNWVDPKRTLDHWPALDTLSLITRCPNIPSLEQ